MEVGDRLAIIEACRALIYRYGYLNDERDYEALAELFTEDAVFCRPSAPDKPITGREAILAAFKTRPTDTVTFHLVTDVLVEVDSADRARARSRILLLSGHGAPIAPTRTWPRQHRHCPGCFAMI